MEMQKGVLKNAWPYMQDKMNLPVGNVEASIPFYQTIMGFKLLSQTGAPHKSAILERDSIQIGLSENGGIPARMVVFLKWRMWKPLLRNLNQTDFKKKSPILIYRNKAIQNGKSFLLSHPMDFVIVLENGWGEKRICMLWVCW